MKLKKYTLEQLQSAVEKSFSYAQVLISLKIKPAGGNYHTLKKAIKFFNLDASHFTGRGWSKNKTFSPKRNINEYLNNSFPIKSYKLKHRLFREGILEHKCSICGIEEWLGKKISLELDHINGNHLDNTLSNLRILCPNCHSQTDTFRSKKR